MKKTSKSPESTEVTPSKKKLKQATLSFAVSSDLSPKTETPTSRKRKLSAPESTPEPLTKIGKTTKEDTVEDSVEISDEDSRDASSHGNERKIVNPYVKLVHSARIKKMQKNKSKKTKTKSSKKQVNGDKEHQENELENQDKQCEDVEMVVENVDSRLENDALSDQENTAKSSDKSQQVKPTEKISNKTNNAVLSESNVSLDSKNEVICLDDSNNSSDVQAKLHKNANPETKEDSLKRENNEKKSSVHKNQITSKRSARNKTNKEKSKANKITSLLQKKESEAKSEDIESSHVKEINKSISTEDCAKLNVSENSDSDVEMIDTEQDPAENENSHESNIESQSDSQENQTPKCKRTNTDSDKLNDIENSDSDVEMIDTKQDSPENENSQESNIESQSDSQENQTPKRKRTKTDSNLNTSTTKLVFDDSINSSPSTPKHNKSLSENSADVSFGGSVKSANLTPKQLQKKLESAKKQEERQKEKLEREKKRQQDKEERAKQKLVREEQRKREREEKEEAKRKEREEKEELRKKEKEEKEKQREMEKKVRELKEELKRKEKEDKEEQRRKEKEAREEERRKKQEALELEKQEQEVKKKKAAEAFVNFFVPKQKTGKEDNIEPMSKSSLLSSFTIKIDMRLAPICRTDLSTERREVLDKSLQEQNVEKTYLKTLKDGSNKPLTSEKTWPLDDKDDEVMIIEDELPPIDGAGEVITCESAPREKLRPKLLSFHENRRPPYWGTWRKKSLFVKPRRPFGQEKLFDYEVDSDDDWEDEGDGESLDGSAGGSEDEGADDYEVDNEVFVPHGYLSDEEATMDEDDVLSLSPETQKARLKHLEDEFETELKKPTEKLKPRLYGLLWENEDGGKPEKCVDALWNYFQKFAMIMDDPTPLLEPAPETEKDTEKKKSKKKKVLVEVNEQSPSSDKKKKKAENKEAKKPKQESKKTLPNQPGINSFLTKVKPT